MSIRIEISKTLKKSTDWPEWFKEVKSNILSLQLADISTLMGPGKNFHWKNRHDRKHHN